MIICHCNIITQKELEEAILCLLDEDCWQLIVPAKVYHALEKRGRCCGCFPNVVETIIRVTENYHLKHSQNDLKILSFIEQVRSLRQQYRSMQHEGRQKDHRAA